MQAHQRLKITKDHTIKSKESAVSETQNASSNGRSIMCHVHSQVSKKKHTKYLIFKFLYRIIVLRIETYEM